MKYRDRQKIKPKCSKCGRSSGKLTMTSSGGGGGHSKGGVAGLCRACTKKAPAWALFRGSYQ